MAYRSATLKTTVMHRIVALRRPALRLPGRQQLLAATPTTRTQDLLLGKLWLRIPQGGKALAALKSPVGMLRSASSGSVVLGADEPVRTRDCAAAGGADPPAPCAHSLPVRALARQVVLVSAGRGRRLRRRRPPVLLACCRTPRRTARPCR